MNNKLMKLQSRPDYVDEVYKALLDAISDGSLAPGMRITQEEIAEQMAVSRSPVLQALRLLKKDGFVQDAPGRGILVSPLDPDWTGRLYEIRGALDMLAVRLAAERKVQIDPELIANGRQASQSGVVKALIDTDIAFHSAIYQASGNPLIAETALVHWNHLRRVMGAVLQSSAQRQSIWDEHEAIANAIADGDSKRAVELTDLHTSRARVNLVKRLDEVLKQQGNPETA
ncbi:GntR family transcriptional regulator [Advenella mimigardefordensis]|uniref:Transcriptional regulator, GntR family n=1 Tax=Advenella mimigardefordensis (strain DSM 17166 / LMG 22922 / DPN7) TaxID=1247726 RepID=W0P9G2_ADVMD|nr:GntR family transcriptional regulator [Advenella mimigardefordensis]AHG63361.1 transcriptional regulator, GntR family [Advenella mimigardefordensis DPN7]